MTENNEAKGTSEVEPSRSDKLKPLELVGFSAVLSIFASLIVLLVTARDFKLALIVLGLVFIVTLMTVALVGLGMKPNPEDLAARKSLEDRDSGGSDFH